MRSVIHDKQDNELKNSLSEFIMEEKILMTSKV